MEERQYYVYILTNVGNSVLYVGVTNDLLRRVDEHRNRAVPGFTSKYNVTKLVYFECADTAYAAIGREKQLRGGSRAKKTSLIVEFNPTWKDLYDSLV